jgi:hypothetical protein
MAVSYLGVIILNYVMYLAIADSDTNVRLQAYLGHFEDALPLLMKARGSAANGLELLM